MNGATAEITATTSLFGLEAVAGLARALDTLSSEQIEELAFSGLIARVREEIEISRAQRPALLMPGYTAIEAAHELTVALRYAKPGDDRSEIVQRAAALMALAARLALEGTPVFPDSQPGGAR